MPDLRVGYAAAGLDELNSVGLIRTQIFRDKVAAQTCQRRGSCSYHNEQYRQGNVLTCNG